MTLLKSIRRSRRKPSKSKSRRKHIKIKSSKRRTRNVSDGKTSQIKTSPIKTHMFFTSKSYSICKNGVCEKVDMENNNGKFNATYTHGTEKKKFNKLSTLQNFIKKSHKLPKNQLKSK